MSLTLKLIIINCVVFVVECIFYKGGFSLSPSFPEQDFFTLSLGGLKHWYLWQLLTYQFMHGGFFHILLNSMALFAFGPDVEEVLGKVRYIIMYLFSGVFGGLLQVFAAWLWPFYSFGGPVVGASASILGVVATYAMLFPERQLQMLLLFVFPVTIRAKYVLFLSVVMAALGISFHESPLFRHIAHFAHMGGILAGLFFVRYAMDWKWSWPTRTTQRKPSAQLVKASKTKSSGWGGGVPPAEDFTPAEFISREVDPILDKISAHGIQSLTEHERKVLEAARKKMDNH